MTDVTVSEARARLADVVDEVREHREPVYLTLRGRRVAAVVDAAYLDWLIELAEDVVDVGAARAARDEIADTGDSAVPWEQVKVDLSLR